MDHDWRLTRNLGAEALTERIDLTDEQWLAVDEALFENDPLLAIKLIRQQFTRLARRLLRAVLEIGDPVVEERLVQLARALADRP